MNRQPLLVGLDVGTSCTKVGIYSTDGRLVAFRRSRSYRYAAPHEGWAEIDLGAVWRLATDAIAEAVADTGEPERIASVGISVFFPTVVAISAAGDALYPAILYSDRRSVKQADAIRESFEAGAFEAMSGNAAVPGTCAATSMMWLKDEYPEVFERTACLGFADTFFLHKLTGELVTDPTHTTLSGLVDIRNPGTWSNAILDRLGIDPILLPQIRGSATQAGLVRKEAASVTGLPEGTVVASGSGDAEASTFGAGVATPESVGYVTGSTDCVVALIPEPSASGQWLNCASVTDEGWTGIGASSSSGASLSWFGRELLSDRGIASSEDLYRELGILHESCAAESAHVLFLPYLQGERSPLWDPSAAGMFAGVTENTTRAELARAVLEGTALSFRDIIDTSPGDVCRRAAEIRTVGGGARFPAWNQIKADVVQRPLSVLQYEETGSLGAALLGGIAAGIYGSPLEAAIVARKAYPAAEVKPRKSLKGLYDDLFERYRSLYQRTRDIVRDLPTTAAHAGHDAGGDNTR